jgi:hypothetical protein
MIQYAEILIDKCGYHQHDYDLMNMSFEEVSSLIDELKEELGWNEERGSRHAKRRD